MQEVDVYPKSPERLTPLIGAERAERLRFAVQEAHQAIDGATVWHINATASSRPVHALHRVDHTRNTHY
jgi:hypothetical protein